MSTKKGFTLVEIIIAIAILAILIGLSLLGVQTVQRSSRDAERRSTVERINYEITDYFGNNYTYPIESTVSINRTTNVLTLDGRTVQLTGAGLPLTLSDLASTSTGSVYCYSQSGNTYSIGVNLESGNWFNLGDETPCQSANL